MLKIEEAINKSIKPSFYKIKNLRLLISSMFITLTEDGKVEAIMFSDTPEGLFKAKEKIEKDLKDRINELNLDKSLFADKYILAVIIIGSSERVSSATTEMPENWAQLFTGIDIQKLNGKSLKYCIPIGIQYLGAVTD